MQAQCVLIFTKQSLSVITERKEKQVFCKGNLFHVPFSSLYISTQQHLKLYVVYAHQKDGLICITHKKRANSGSLNNTPILCECRCTCT